MELKTMKKPIAKDDLLFHSVHGLCRVASVTPATQPAKVSYALLPVSKNRAKVRFVVPQSSLEESGFSQLISVKEANSILEYLKTGHKKDSDNNSAWAQAVVVWSESTNMELLKDKRRRQILERSVKGLAGELAFVLQVTLTEIAEKIQKNLGSPSKINPVVLAALESVDEE